MGCLWTFQRRVSAAAGAVLNPFLLYFCFYSRCIQKNTKIWHFPRELCCSCVTHPQSALHPTCAKRKLNLLLLGPVSLERQPTICKHSRGRRWCVRTSLDLLIKAWQFVTWIWGFFTPLFLYPVVFQFCAYGTLNVGWWQLYSFLPQNSGSVFPVLALKSKEAGPEQTLQRSPGPLLLPRLKSFLCEQSWILIPPIGSPGSS